MTSAKPVRVPKTLVSADVSVSRSRRRTRRKALLRWHVLSSLVLFGVLGQGSRSQKPSGEAFELNGASVQSADRARYSLTHMSPVVSS